MNGSTRLRGPAAPAMFVAVASFFAQMGAAQQNPAVSQIVTLTVPSGVPLHVILDTKVPVKDAGISVDAHTVDPVYVFDDLVIPAGSKVLGRVASVETAPRKQRALAIANGNFSPLRKAHVDFDTLVLKDGRRIPFKTEVTQGAPSLVRLEAGEQRKKKKTSRVREAVAQGKQEAKAQEQEAVQELKAPGKMQRIKARLWAEFPYHNPSIAAGTEFTGVLNAPLELGQEDRSIKQLERVGAEIPPGSNVHVRLLTGLSSAIDHQGSPVRAVVSEPVFSSAHQLILPEGAQLEGLVTQVMPARRLGRNGQLRFSFRRIELGAGAPRKVQATLQAVDAAPGDHLQLDAEGGAHAVTPKTKYIAPAIDVLLATTSLHGPDHDRDGIGGDLGRQGSDAAGGAVRGAAGFGLVGAVIGFAVRYRPVSAAFAFYGAGWSVYTHVVARGNDVVFPRNTPMEIRFGTHGDSASPTSKGKPFVSELPKAAKAS